MHVRPKMRPVAAGVLAVVAVLAAGTSVYASEPGAVDVQALIETQQKQIELLQQQLDATRASLESLSQQLLETTRCQKLLIKLAAEGFIAYDRDSDGRMRSQPFPALSVNPLDVTGAGDSVLAVMATGLASRQAMMPTAALACCMAALAVETMGNTPIDAKSLSSSLDEALAP